MKWRVLDPSGNQLALFGSFDKAWTFAVRYEKRFLEQRPELRLYTFIERVQ